MEIELQIGEIVKVIEPGAPTLGVNARVKILQLHTDNTATVEILFTKRPPLTVSLSILVPNTQVTQLVIPTFKPTTLHTPPSHTFTPKPQPKVPHPFDPIYFTDTGTKISCRCGNITRLIPPSLIKSWNNENAAINYVIGLCSYCTTPHRPRYNATGSFAND